MSLFKRREVLVALAMFILPSASFALTNTLGGWGKDFYADPGLVSFFGGVGSIVAGIDRQFPNPAHCQKISVAPHVSGHWNHRRLFHAQPAVAAAYIGTFGLAFFGENLFQAAAFATSFAIIYEVIGKGNPLAATIFAVLTNALNFPIFYMEIVDGHGFDWNGITGAFLVDAIVSGGVCIVLYIVLFKVLRVQNMRTSAKLQSVAETE